MKFVLSLVDSLDPCCHSLYTFQDVLGYHSKAVSAVAAASHPLRSIKWEIDQWDYSQNCRNLGDFPTARAPRSNFSSQSRLPHLAKHLSFFLGFLFLLRAKKPQNNENLSGSTPLLVTMMIFFPFTEAKILDKGLSATCDSRVDSDAGILERLCTWQNGHRDKFCCYRGRLHDQGRSSDNFENRIEHCFWDGGHNSSSFSVFRKDETDFDARGDTAITRVLVCFQPPGRLPFRRVWSRTMERWASAAVSDIHGSYRYTLHMYHREL